MGAGTSNLLTIIVTVVITALIASIGLGIACVVFCVIFDQCGRRSGRRQFRETLRTLGERTPPPQPEITVDTDLRAAPPPNYSKVGLYLTDENYGKEHHTYIRPVDSDDVFDNRSEPPGYESRIRMSIGSRQSEIIPPSANDPDIDQPPCMRLPTDSSQIELNTIEETTETDRPTDPSQRELNTIEETIETDRPTDPSQRELNIIEDTTEAGRPTDNSQGELNVTNDVEVPTEGELNVIEVTISNDSD